MGTRAQLHNELLAICDNVYYQTPEGFKMVYPCIRYARNDINIEHANNKPYAHSKGYSIMVISSNGDEPINDSVLLLPTCSFEKSYKYNNLYHDVYNINY